MENKKQTGLTKKHWFGYMCGDWGGCMTFTLMASIFSVFCTNALGIDPKLAPILKLTVIDTPPSRSEKKKYEQMRDDIKETAKRQNRRHY